MSAPDDGAWEIVVPDEPAMRRLASALAPEIGAEGVVLSLHGDLGAGKTVFVQALGRALGVAPDLAIVSPTFTIARSYPVRDGLVLHHLDAYRLDGADDLENVGFEDMCGIGRVTCVEWGRRVEEGLPGDRIDLWITPLPPARPPTPGEVPGGPRRVRVLGRGARARALAARWQDAVRAGAA